MRQMKAGSIKHKTFHYPVGKAVSVDWIKKREKGSADNFDYLQTCSHKSKPIETDLYHEFVSCIMVHDLIVHK